MFYGKIWHKSWIGLVASSLLALSAPAVGRADFIVAPGFDLLTTAQDTVFFFPPFGFIPLEGVALGTYDFGDTVGERDTGTADTLVERLAPADSGGMPGTAPPIPIELVALQLKSDDDFFVTLQSERGLNPLDPPPGPASTGTMTITFTDMEGGTFDSTLDVHFDVRTGALDGEIFASGSKVFMSTGTDWDRFPAFDASEISDVNAFLKGDGTRDQDFWPEEIIELDPVDDSMHVVRTATRTPTVEIPTLNAAGIIAMVVLMVAVVIWRMRRVA